MYTPDVARGKPSPDLYLLAAARFSLKPEVCVAVEDSNHGVTAAHAAGNEVAADPSVALVIARPAHEGVFAHAAVQRVVAAEAD